MKKIIIGLILMLIIVLTCCQPAEITCNKPYIKVGTKCCLDVNGNNICDKDEEEELTKETISDQKENAENIAKLFLVHWERKDYSKMYDLMLGSLTGLKSKDKFVKLMEMETINDYINSLRYESVVMENSNSAYVQYTLVTDYHEIKAPSIVLEYVEGEWKVDAFASVFLSSCGDDKCQASETFNKWAGKWSGSKLNCPLDCFTEQFRLGVGGHKELFFLGEGFHIELIKIDGYHATIKVLNKEIILGFNEEIKLKKNIYIEHGVNSKESAMFTIFNKDV
jgi:hypothetical protein